MMNFSKETNLFYEQHPFLDQMTQYYGIFIFILMCVVLVATIAVKRKRDTLFKLMSVLIVVAGTLTIITSFGILNKYTHGPAVIYKSHAVVNHIEPVDENNKQRITLQQGNDQRVLNLNIKQISHLKNHDYITFNVVYQPETNLFDAVTSNFADKSMMNKDGSYKKHIPFKDIKFNEFSKIRNIDKE